MFSLYLTYEYNIENCQVAHRKLSQQKLKEIERRRALGTKVLHKAEESLRTSPNDCTDP